MIFCFSVPTLPWHSILLADIRLRTKSGIKLDLITWYYVRNSNVSQRWEYILIRIFSPSSIFWLVENGKLVSEIGRDLRYATRSLKAYDVCWLGTSSCIDLPSPLSCSSSDFFFRCCLGSKSIVLVAQLHWCDGMIFLHNSSCSPVILPYAKPVAGYT